MSKKKSTRDELRAGLTTYSLVKIHKGNGWFELEHAEVPKYMSPGDVSEVYRGIHKGRKKYREVEVLS